MKQIYMEPEIDMIRINGDEVIRTSGEGPNDTEITTPRANKTLLLDEELLRSE